LYFDVSFYDGIFLYIIDLSYDVRITELLYIVPKYTTFIFCHDMKILALLTKIEELAR